MSAAATRAWNDQQVVCPACGTLLLRVHVNRHRATQKHADALRIRSADGEADAFFSRLRHDDLFSTTQPKEKHMSQTDPYIGETFRSTDARDGGRLIKIDEVAPRTFSRPEGYYGHYVDQYGEPVGRFLVSGKAKRIRISAKTLDKRQKTSH